MRRFAPSVASLLCVVVTATGVAQDTRRNDPDRRNEMRREDRGDRGGDRRRRRDGDRVREGEGTGSYELRGFFGAGHETEISLRLSGTDKAYWIRVGDRVKDLYVEKADPVVGTAVIVSGGTRYKLRLAGEIPAAARTGPQVLGEAGAEPAVVVAAGQVVQAQGTLTVTGGATATTALTLRLATPAQAAGGENPPPAPPAAEPAPAAPVQSGAPIDTPPPPAAQR